MILLGCFAFKRMILFFGLLLSPHMLTWMRPYSMIFANANLNYSLFQDGDITIGALFPVFSPAAGDDNKCSDQFMMGQALVVYALVFAIQRINAYQDLLQNVRIGFDVKPTCSDPVIALIESIKFIDRDEGTPRGYNLTQIALDSGFTLKGNTTIFGSLANRSMWGKPATQRIHSQMNIDRAKRSTRPLSKDVSKGHYYYRYDLEENNKGENFLKNQGATNSYIPQVHYIDENHNVYEVSNQNPLYGEQANFGNIWSIPLHNEKEPLNVISIKKRQVTTPDSSDPLSSRVRIKNPNPLVLSNFLPEETSQTSSIISTSAGLTSTISHSPEDDITTPNVQIFEPINITRSTPDTYSASSSNLNFPSIPSELTTLETTQSLEEREWEEQNSRIGSSEMTDQERAALAATINFMNKEPQIKALIEGLGNAAKIISPLLSSYQIPQISYKNSDENLANKMFYPYLIRFSISNQKYVDALVRLLKFYEWNYVNILYQDEDNSENLYELLKARLATAKMCTFMETRLDDSDETMPAKLDNFTDSIMKYVSVAPPTDSNGTNWDRRRNNGIRAKIIFTFLTTDKIIEMFKYFNTRANNPIYGGDFIPSHFIFLGVYSWPQPMLMEINGLGHRLSQISALIMRQIEGKIVDYLTWFREKATIIYAREPLMRSYREWQNIFITNHTELVSRYTNITNLTINDINNPEVAQFFHDVEEEIFGLEISQIIESAEILAEALNNIRSRLCPKALEQTLFDCIQGEDIYNEMNSLIRERRFIGSQKDADTFGEVMLALRNLRPVSNSNIEFTEVQVGYYYLDNLLITKDITLLNYTFQDDISQAPTSICSLPCPPKQYKIYKSNLCCWECAKCQVNEIMTTDKDKPCAACPRFTWPDQETETKCLDIQPKTLQSYTFTYYVMPVLQIIGLFAWALVVIFFIKNYGHPTMNEMGGLIIILFIIGIFLGLISHFNYFGYPARIKCTMCYFFKYGSAVLYCAGTLAELSTSKNFIMRNRDMVDIFRNELTQYEKRRQVMVACLVIAIQVIFSFLLFYIFPIYPLKEQVAETLNEVLVFCPAKTPNTAFNIVQISYVILLLLISIYLISREQSLLKISSALRYLSFCIYISLFLSVMMLPINFSMKSFLSRIMFDFVLFIILNLVFLLFLADFAIFRLYTLKTYHTGNAREEGGPVVPALSGLNQNKNTTTTRFGGTPVKR